MHKAPFTIIAVAISWLGAEMRDEGIELGETLLAHPKCRTQAVKALIDEVLVVMLDHTLRLMVQGVSWQALDLQEE